MIFIETDTPILKFIRKRKFPDIKTNFEREKVNLEKLFHFRTYFKVTIMKVVWYW